MAEFNYDSLRQKLADALGYHLFLDYGTVEDYTDLPHRVVNTIVTPVVGLFRLNPTPLTAMKYPYIAVTTATIDIPAPTEKAEDVRDALNGLAATYNATAEKIRQDNSSYTVVYSFETAVIGDKRRDVSLYNGEIIPVTQVVTFTIVEAGMSCFDVSMKIDGMEVPLLLFMETRTAASETAPNANAKGEITIAQELYGITFETPAVDNDLGDLLREMVDEGNGNRAHVVEVTKLGVTKVYMMAVGTAGATVQPPNNVGYSFSLAEIAPAVARFCGLWSDETITGAVATINKTASVVFWGDGTASNVNGYALHTYTDGKTSHTARVFTYSQYSRWAPVTSGSSLNGKRVRVDTKSIDKNWTFPKEIVKTDKGDTINLLSDYVLEMKLGDQVLKLYHETIIDANSPSVKYGFDEFVSLLRGKVISVSGNILTYDQWAVSEEV